MTRFLWTNLLIMCALTQVLPAGSEKTYVIDGQDRVTWDEAFKLCQQRGMQLVSVESPEESDRLRQILGPASLSEPAKDFWTSGTLTEGNQWVWASTGRPLVFVDWVAGAPNDYLGHEKCLRLWGLRRFQWDDFFCQAKLHFICQMPEPDPEPRIESVDEPNSDFDYANIVTVRGPPKDEDTWAVAPTRKAPPTQRVPTKGATTQELNRRPGPTERPELRLNGFSFAVFAQAALGWVEARVECNGRQMELAVIGSGTQAEKIRQFLVQNGLEHDTYWIGYMHVGPGAQRPRARRAFDQWSEQAEPPSIQLTIGVKPGPGSSMVGTPTGQCPLLKPTDGMRLVFERCQAKNFYICEKSGLDLI